MSEPPPGQHLDERRQLVLTGSGGVLHVAAAAASCDEGVEHPACHITQQDWGIRVRVVAGATDRLGLVLRGPAA